ncbi:unnamed protein product [Urochloa humidicola]
MAPNQSRLVLLAALFLVAAVGQVRCESLGNFIAIINGTVPCSTGSDINVASALPFPNATVQLVCSTATVASARTGSTGIVSFILGPIANLPTTLLVNLLTGQCRVVVATPLVACNASLNGVTGTLSSSVQLLNVTSGVVINILGFSVPIVNDVVNFVPSLFNFI